MEHAQFRPNNNFGVCVMVSKNLLPEDRIVSPSGTYETLACYMLITVQFIKFSWQMTIPSEMIA